MKITKPKKLHNKHNEIYYDRRVLSKNYNTAQKVKNSIPMEKKICKK